MTDTTNNSDTDKNNHTTTPQLSFIAVAEKTWELHINGEATNIVIDLLTGTDPGPAQSPEIRVYNDTDTPTNQTPVSQPCDVIRYSNTLSPENTPPTGTWKPNENNATLIIHIPHENEPVPAMEVTFADNSTEITSITPLPINK